MNLQRDFISSSSIQKELNEFYDRPITRVSLELIFSIVTVIVFALFALRPTLVTMSTLLREIQQKRELDTQLSQKISSLSTAQSQLTTYQPQVTALQKAILRNASVEDVAYYLEYLLQDSGLSVKSISFGNIPALLPRPVETDEVLPLTQYQTQVVVSGEKDQIEAFLARVEKVKPLFSVEGWTLHSNTEPDQPSLEAAIKIDVYIYGKPAATATQVQSKSGSANSTGSTSAGI